MTKSQLIDRISMLTGVDKDTVALVLAEMNDSIGRALKQDEEVKISGLGTFYPAKRKPKKGRNPRTGQTIEIPERRIAKFRPGKNLQL